MPIKKQTFEKIKPLKIIYKDSDLAILDKKIRENYGDFRNGDMYNKYFIDNGGLKKYSNGELSVVEPNVYGELNNKISQWHDWRQRQEFTEEKKIEGLKKVAESWTPDNW